MDAPVNSATIALATTVFGINELFEIILSHLPPRDLLLLQRTATIWRDTVRRSATIQTKLYYSRDDPKIETAWIQPRNMWLTMRELRGEERRTLRFASVSHVGAHEVFSFNASHNELLGSQNTTRHLTRRIADGEILHVHEWVRKAIFRDERELSCDDMFVTQPPARRLMLIMWCKCGCQFWACTRDIISEFDLSCPGGVKVKDIRKAVRERYSRGCVFDIRIKVLRELWRDKSEQWGLLFPTADDGRYLEQAKLYRESIRAEEVA